MPPRREGRLRRVLRGRSTWLGLATGLIGLVALLTLTQPLPLPYIDRLLQDHVRARAQLTPSDDIVIVAIDDPSVQAVGRWPWRRAVHADLLRRIARDGPHCIGLNLMFTESDAAHPQDDRILADGMLDSGCVVLPMALLPRPAELLPVPVLAEAATAIGHAQIAVDDDGVTRGVALFQGFGERLWPHFTLAMLRATHAGSATQQGIASPDWRQSPHPEALGALNGRELQALLVMPARSPAAHAYRTVSYIDVLHGKVPAGTFKNRYVLVGVTAAGLGDSHAIASAVPGGRMSGIQIFANALQTQLEGRRRTVATPWQDVACNLVPVTLALLGLLWLRPLGVVMLNATLLVAWLGIYNARPWVDIEFHPAAGILGLLSIYPLWSLLQLSTTLRYLRRIVRIMQASVDGLPAPSGLPAAGDYLGKAMATTSAVAAQLRELHRLVRDGVDHMTDPTLVLDATGRIVIANLAAATHLNADPRALVGRDTHTVLADLRWRDTGAPMLPAGTLDMAQARPVIGEGTDGHERILLLRCVPFFDVQHHPAGWTCVLVDITAMRQAQSQRDEALRFISHDIRAPSASILTTLELARMQPARLNGEALYSRIERQARTGLALADGFVHLARAEVQPFHAEPLDLVALLVQGIDDAWAEARRREVRVVLDTALAEAACTGDRSLLTRALANVLSNAIKYSPRGAQVQCRLAACDGTHWAVAVQDHGPGIATALQSQLFQPFHRLHHESHPEVQGIGLGLLLVRTAMLRHGGRVEIDSAAGKGCTVTLLLPCAGPNDIEATKGRGP